MPNKYLEGEFEDVKKKLEELKILVFPERILPEGHQAYWPDDDVNGFIDFAKKSKVQVMYMASSQFKAETLINMILDLVAEHGNEEKTDDLKEKIEKIVDHPSITTLKKKVSTYIGKIMLYSLDFVIGGVAHHFIKHAQWFESLYDELHDLVTEMLEEIENEEEKESFN